MYLYEGRQLKLGPLGGSIQMRDEFPSSTPQPHREFLSRLERLKSDDRIVGVAAGGSYLTNSMDEFSDLDLVLAIEPRSFSEVMRNRRSIAASLGELLAAFTGEHVGEPRVLICLYGAPLLHVDLKFISLDDISSRVEDPAILWQRQRRLAEALAVDQASYPVPDLEWIEERFWIWVHYAATKIGRGELFEAVDFLSFLRVTVLGPLGLSRAGGRPTGVRRIETVAPVFCQELRRTLAGHDAVECLRALRSSIELYRSLRSTSNETQVVGPAERSAMAFLASVESRCSVARR